MALGRGQSPRGLKKRGQRPDYILIDDIDDDALCRNEARVREAFNWMMTALFGAMAAGRGRFIMVGNRISKQSILARFAETKLKPFACLSVPCFLTNRWMISRGMRRITCANSVIFAIEKGGL